MQPSRNETIGDSSEAGEEGGNMPLEIPIYNVWKQQEVVPKSISGPGGGGRYVCFLQAGVATPENRVFEG